MRPPRISGGRIVFYVNFRCPFSAVRQAIVALGLQYFRCAAINAAPRQSSQAGLGSALGLQYLGSALGLQYFRCAAINAAPRQSSQASLDSALGLLFILKDVFSR